MTNWQGNIAKLAIPTGFAVGDVNVYAVKGDVLALIDSGVRTKEGLHALEQGLRDLGYSLKDVEQVVLTHHHPDHAGGLEFFSDTCKIIGHSGCRRWLNMTQEFQQQLKDFFTGMGREFGVPEAYISKMLAGGGEIISPRNLDEELADGGEVPGLPGWTAVETLGHAQSHLSFYREQDGVMIGGDHLLAHISPNPILEPPIVPGEERPKPLLQYNESLKEWLDMPISKVFTGHGSEIEQVQELISLRFERQHGRAMQVKEMLKAQPSSGMEICMRLFPKVYKRELGLTISETQGQLDYLVKLGEAVKEKKAGVIQYTAV